MHIACGSEHSVVLDSRGVAWTWGGEGRSFLGHGETGIGAANAGEGAQVEAQAWAMGLGTARLVGAGTALRRRRAGGRGGVKMGVG